MWKGSVVLWLLWVGSSLAQQGTGAAEAVPDAPGDIAEQAADEGTASPSETAAVSRQEAEPDCEDVTEKNATGATLTVAESNLLMLCFTLKPVELQEILSQGWVGFQAYQPPTGLLDQYEKQLMGPGSTGLIGG